MSLIIIIFIILFLMSGGVGYYGNTAGWGPWGWSPLGLIVVFLLILLLTGRLQ
jgi:hypothetical protein